MNLQVLFDRILQAVDEEAYLTPALHVDPRQRAAMEEIGRAIQDPAFDAERVRALIRDHHAHGRIDRVLMLSALHVVAAHPKVAQWAEAARLAGEQEQAALELGGPNLAANLASVDRHRGVLAFLQDHHDLALDYFSRAFERERTAENLGNVLCTLLAMGDLREARDLLRQVRGAFPADLVAQLDQRIAHDPDLALLNEGGISS